MASVSKTAFPIDQYSTLGATMNRHLIMRNAIDLCVNVVKYFLLGLASGLVIALLT